MEWQDYSYNMLNRLLQNAATLKNAVITLLHFGLFEHNALL